MPPLEIERTYLLSGVPEMPGDPCPLEIRQGYLATESGGSAAEGRLRHSTHPDGTIVCHHTVKEGSGLVRTEAEVEISPAEFEARWPGTRGARLQKRRYRVADGSFTWEIDVFDEPAGLVLAEVELPDPQTVAPVPAWLAPYIVREVTDDPSFTNFAIARRLGATSDDAHK